MRTHIASALFASTLAVGLVAQTVHLVGPGGYATIQQAVNAAAPDDIVHVQAGTYFSFTVQKSLRIRALGPVTLGTSETIRLGGVTGMSFTTSFDFIFF